MSGCTAPINGHRTASGRENCPVCRHRARRNVSYLEGVGTEYPGVGAGKERRSASGKYTGGNFRRTRNGRYVSYSASEWRTFRQITESANIIAHQFPQRRDLFLCHAWGDRQKAANDLYEALLEQGATVWFSEYDVKLGANLIGEIDRGLRNSRVGIVLVTKRMLETLAGASGIASQELSALLATDRVIPVAYHVNFEELRAVSPLLGARSGVAIGIELSLKEAAAKIAASVALENEIKG